MRQECVIYVDSRNDSTLDEPWTLARSYGHHYSKQADFALSGLGKGPGSCLVIGSPLFEALELMKAGWDVTYVDVREPPKGYPFRFVQGDASQLDLGEDIYDAASTTCVLCHAGMGRYGDPLSQDADELIMNNIFRALKKGGRAAVTFGPVAAVSMPMRIGNVHRIYNYATADALAKSFAVLDTQVLDIISNEIASKFHATKMLSGDYYLSMLLEKPDGSESRV